MSIAEHACPVAPATQLPGVLLDGIAEALLLTVGQRERSLMVLTLIGEIHDTAAWLIDDPESSEATSLRRVISAARAHHDRMSRPDPTPATVRDTLAAIRDRTGLVSHQNDHKANHKVHHDTAVGVVTSV